MSQNEIEKEITLEKWKIPSFVSNEGADLCSLKEEEGFRDEFQSLKNQAEKTGYEKGFQEGLRAADDQVADKLRLLDTLFSKVNSLESDDLASIENKVTHLVKLLVKQIIRREIDTDNGNIVAIVHQALNTLPELNQKVRVYLHPEDIKFLSHNQYFQPSEYQHLHFIKDPNLSVGGCRLETEKSVVDASIDSTLSSLFLKVFGEKRKISSSGDIQE